MQTGKSFKFDLMNHWTAEKKEKDERNEGQRDRSIGIILFLSDGSRCFLTTLKNNNITATGNDENNDRGIRVSVHLELQSAVSSVVSPWPLSFARTVFISVT